MGDLGGFTYTQIQCVDFLKQTSSQDVSRSPFSLYSHMSLLPEILDLRTMQAAKFKAILTAGAVIAVSLFALPSTTDAQSKTNSYQRTVGKLHVDFEMPSVADDKPIKLSDFAGKKVLLINFASW